MIDDSSDSWVQGGRNNLSGKWVWLAGYLWGKEQNQVLTLYNVQTQFQIEIAESRVEDWLLEEWQKIIFITLVMAKAFIKSTHLKNHQSQKKDCKLDCA